MQTTHGTATDPIAHHNAAIDDLRGDFGDRWEIAAIAQGYRAVLRETGGRGPVVLYGRTPAELAESVRMAQVPLRGTP